MSGNINMVKKLLSRPELTVDLQDSEGNTPVHKAASTLSDEIMFLLIERNPKVTSVMNTQQKTCIDLYQARGKQAGQQKKVDALLEKIANLS
jgi:ankyrin repeat protein